MASKAPPPAAEAPPKSSAPPKKAPGASTKVSWSCWDGGGAEMLTWSVCAGLSRSS